MSEEKPTTYPSKTVLQTFNIASFENNDTKITNAALEGAVEYLRVFTREAIWRAEHNKLEQEGGNYSGERILDVKHLESIAGVLTMDF